MDLDALASFIPAKYAGIAFALWGVVYYLVGPWMKRQTGRPILVTIGEWITQDTHRPPKPGAEKPADPPKGYGLIFALAVVALILGGLMLLWPPQARADDPKFGGCLARSPATCFAPAVSVNVLAMSLADGTLTSTFDPGIGYGVTFASDRWYKTGLSTTVAFPTYDAGRRLMPSAILSFAEYARLGVGCPLYVQGGFSRNGFLLLGFGSDFGAAAR